MRKEFEMTGEEYEAIMNASKPVICIAPGGVGPSSPQENANRAWEALGKKRGFDHMTVRPVTGKSARFFTAEIKELK